MLDRRELVLSIVLALAGCGPSPGAAGLWDLRIGGTARIIAGDGASEVVAETLAAPKAKPRRSRKAKTPKVESAVLAVGTRASVLAVDGDDARIRIEDGPRAGLVLWIECRHLSAE